MPKSVLAIILVAVIVLALVVILVTVRGGGQNDADIAPPTPILSPPPTE